MPGEWTQVPTFGGGLDFSKDPAALDPSQWGWCQNMWPLENSAVTSPTYDLAIPANYAFTPAQTLVGVLQNPFSLIDPLLLVTTELGAFPRRVHLYKAGTAPSDVSTPLTRVTEIPWDAVGTAVTRYDVHTAVQSAFLNGRLCVTVGAGPAGFSVAQWDGGAAFSTITGGKTTLRFAHLASFAGHLIGAGVDFTEAGARTIRISDAQDQTVWTPAISNSADVTVLDDSVSGITGLVLLEQNMLGVFTRAACYGLAPTGNIPAFTRAYLGMHVACDVSDVNQTPNVTTMQSASPFVGATPFGAAYMSYENVYLGLGQQVGMPVAQAIFGSAGQPAMARVLWHNWWRLVLVPSLFYPDGMYVLNPVLGAWGRMNQPGASASSNNDQTILLYGVPNSDVSSPRWKHVWTNAGAVYVERTYPRTFGTPDTRLAYVDTKDFALPAGRYVDRMRVDWESVTGTPALTVQVLTREELDPQTEFLNATPQPTPTTGYYYDLTGAFAAMPTTHQGTLAPGTAEVPLRARGKWVRFRFSHTGGQVRIRGFAFRMTEASDRATSPEATSGPFPAEWNEAVWNIGSWKGPT
jgi:hypothetical protein